MPESNSSNLEDNLPMVNYIMLHRVYDVLCLIAKQLGDVKEIEKMVYKFQEELATEALNETQGSFMAIF
jgi:hypothetical protein